MIIHNVIGTTFYRATEFDAPRRYVIIVDTQIKGEYPLDEQDLLELKTK